MKLGERVGRFVPDRLRPPIPAKTYAGFLEALHTEGARKITAAPTRKHMVREVDPDTGASADGWRYKIDFTGEGRNGRRIRFERVCSDQVSQDTREAMIGVNPVEMLEQAWLLTTYVTADTLLTEISEQLPECQTVLMDDGKPFTQEQYEELRRDAKMGHIRPWEES